MIGVTVSKAWLSMVVETSIQGAHAMSAGATLLSGTAGGKIGEAGDLGRKKGTGTPEKYEWVVTGFYSDKEL